MQVSLRQLEYAVAVAKHLNFSEAARSCHVSQPALSAQLQQLERSLGVALFERKSRGVLITEAGRDFVGKAELIVRQVRDLMQGARSYREPLCTDLRLGVIPTVAPYILPQVVTAVHDAFPKLRLYITEDTTERLCEELEAGDLDVLLLALDVPLPRLEERELFRDPFYAAMPPEHPLAEREEVSIEDLEEEELLLLGEGHCLSTHIIDACGGRDRVSTATFRANSLSTLLQMVTTGAGVTLIPEIAVRAETACSPRLVVRPLAEKARAFRRIGLVWRPSAPREAEYEQVAKLLAGLRFLGDARDVD